MSTTISFPPPCKTLTMNQRLHRMAEAALVKQWRQAACEAAVAAELTITEPQRVTVTIPVKGQRRRDPLNWASTVKPILDGITDSGAWPDDDSTWVTSTEPILEINGDLVHVHMEPRT
jgi:hypothetical protein